MDTRTCIAQCTQYEYESTVFTLNNVSDVRRLKLLREQVRNSPVGILVGNKADLQDKRAVKFTDGAKLARTHELTFIEASAADSKNIADVSCCDSRSRLFDELHGICFSSSARKCSIYCSNSELRLYEYVSLRAGVRATGRVHLRQAERTGGGRELHCSR